jgi:GNAT superfamily N-acetyltransferase
MDIEIKKLAPALLEDFLYLFDNTAFTDNPHWASCYCYFYHANCSGEEWKKRTAQENKKATINLISAGKMHGFLAYSGGTPVAWCHTDLRRNLPQLNDFCNEEDIKYKIGSIVCFIVAPEYRKKGIATRLLEHAISDFKDNCYNIIEAYPKLTGETDSENHHGPLQMYLNHGFVQFEGNDIFAIVRKNIS